MENLTAQQVAYREAIIHFIASSITNDHLSCCRDMAIEHFMVRDHKPETLDSLMEMIDWKQVLPGNLEPHPVHKHR